MDGKSVENVKNSSRTLFKARAHYDEENSMINIGFEIGRSLGFCLLGFL